MVYCNQVSSLLLMAFPFEALHCICPEKSPNFPLLAQKTQFFTVTSLEMDTIAYGISFLILETIWV